MNKKQSELDMALNLFFNDFIQKPAASQDYNFELSNFWGQVTPFKKITSP